MIYYFYNNIDKKKEPVNQVEAPNIETALSYFAKVKNLPESEFLKIYSIGIKNK
jgi:hypothetical protein